MSVDSRVAQGRDPPPPLLPDSVNSRPLLLADIHGLHLGSCEPLPAALDLLARAHPPVHQQEDRGDAPPHLRHCRQLLLQHETQQPGPVLYHQVGGTAPLPVRAPALCPPVTILETVPWLEGHDAPQELAVPSVSRWIESPLHLCLTSPGLMLAFEGNIVS